MVDLIVVRVRVLHLTRVSLEIRVQSLCKNSPPTKYLFSLAQPLCKFARANLRTIHFNVVFETRLEID